MPIQCQSLKNKSLRDECLNSRDNHFPQNIFHQSRLDLSTTAVAFFFKQKIHWNHTSANGLSKNEEKKDLHASRRIKNNARNGIIICIELSLYGIIVLLLRIRTSIIVLRSFLTGMFCFVFALHFLFQEYEIISMFVQLVN